MATREIRTTLALDGEQKFKREMQAAARELRVLGSEMRANTASFGDNANSMDALSSRSAIYERQVAQQREIIAALNRAVEESAQVYGEADRRTDGYRIQLNNATAALRNMERQLAENDEAIDNYARSSIQAARDSEEMQLAQEELSKTLDLVKGAVVAVAAAITATFVSAASFSNESQQALNGLQAQTGATTEEMSKLKETANEIYTDNFGESIKDVTDSMAVVTQTTKQTGDELKKTTEQALLMRDTFGFEVSESINTVNSLMANFGITSEQAYNLMAQGAQQGANKNGDLLDVMNEYAPHFAQLGLSAEEFTDTLIQGAASGAFQIDKVGDAVKEFGIRAKDGSDTSAAGFAALGLNAQEMFNAFAKGGPMAEKAFQDVIQRLGDMKDPLAQNQVGVALFGTMFEDLGIDAIKALGDIEDYAKTDADTLEQINAVRFNDIGAALEGLRRQLITDIAGPIGDELTPKIGEIVQKVKEFDMAPVINALTWILDNAGTIAALAVGIGAGMATWNVVTTVLAVVEAVKAWRIATQDVAIAQAALNLVMEANPIGIVITAVAGLVAGLIVLWNTNEDFRSALTTAWEMIKATGEAVWGWLSKFFTEDIPAGISTAISWVAQLPAKAAEFFNELPGLIGYALGFAIGTLIQWGRDSVQWAVTEIPKIISNIMTFFSQLPGKLQVQLSIGLTNLVLWAKNMLTTVSNEVPKITSNIVQFFSELPGEMLEIGENIVRGLWDGIKNSADWLWDRINAFADNIIRGFKDAFEIKSPSHIMRDEVGSMIGAGMAAGIDDSIGEVKAAMARLNRNIIADAQITTSTNASETTFSQMAARGVLGSGKGQNNGVTIKVINQGTIVGSGGMSEFARVVSQEIGSSFGLGTGGSF